MTIRNLSRPALASPRAETWKRWRGMHLFWRSRGAGPVGVASLALVALASTPLGGLLVPLGVLTGSSDRSVAARMVLTLAVAAIVTPVTEQPLAELERSVARPVRAWHAASFALAMLLGCVTIWVVALIAGSSPEPLVRNALGLTGLALVAKVWWGRLAWIAPFVWVLASVLFGYQDGPGAAAWAWPIDDQATTSAWCWACSTLVLGLLVLGWSWTTGVRANRLDHA
jgi:hypothetical protein